MAASISKKKQKPKNRKTKLILEFDEKARIDYLKGFHKRKNERKKLAREKQDKRILEERKELLKQARDLKNNQMRQQSVVIPEIEHLVDPEVYDLPEHTVTIANIGDVDFVGKAGLRLGQNSSDKDSDNETPATANPVQNKSLRQKLATCSNQLSSTKLKAKKMKKKHMLRQKFQTLKKGEKKGKKKKHK